MVYRGYVGCIPGFSRVCALYRGGEGRGVTEEVDAWGAGRGGGAKGAPQGIVEGVLVVINGVMRQNNDLQKCGCVYSKSE